jgi:hypothetical protein
VTIINLVRDLFEDGEVAWIPGLHNQVRLAVHMAHRGVMDVDEIL